MAHPTGDYPPPSPAKRGLDVLLSGLALLALSPLLLPVMLLLRLTGEGEVFFIQERVGMGGHPFGLYKFATMRKNSEKISTITSKNDPRVLPVGRLLRFTKINELPQLLNILKGDMSVVGPRPLTADSFAYYSPEIQRIVSLMRPGLTGMGSLVFRNESEILDRSDKPVVDCYREDIAPLKGALEAWYLERRGLLLDLKIILVTAISVVWSDPSVPVRWFDIRELIEASPLRRAILGEGGS